MWIINKNKYLVLLLCSSRLVSLSYHRLANKDCYFVKLSFIYLTELNFCLYTDYTNCNLSKFNKRKAR